MKEQSISKLFTFQSPFLLCFEEGLEPKIIYPKSIENKKYGTIYIDECPIPIARNGFSLTKIEDKLYLIGGKYSVTVLGPDKDKGKTINVNDLVWVFDLKKMNWKQIPTLMLYKRENIPLLHHHFACHYKNGNTDTIICIGGLNSDVVSRDIWILTIVGKDCFTWKKLETIGRDQPDFSSLQTYHEDVFSPENGRVTVYDDCLWVLSKSNSFSTFEIHSLNISRRIWMKISIHDQLFFRKSLSLNSYLFPEYYSNDSLNNENFKCENNLKEINNHESQESNTVKVPFAVIKTFEDTSYSCLLSRNNQLSKYVISLLTANESLKIQLNDSIDRENLIVEKYHEALSHEREENIRVVKSLEQELDLTKQVLSLDRATTLENQMKEMQDEIKLLRETIILQKDNKILQLENKLHNIQQESMLTQTQLEQEKARNATLSLEIEYNIMNSLLERTNELSNELLEAKKRIEESIQKR